MINNTKRILADALCEVLKKKSLKKITVDDIVSVCGASRQTFYNHFKDKYDLINWIYVDEHKRALSMYGPNMSWREALYLSYMVFWENKQFYVVAAKSDGPNSFLNYLWEFCNEFYENSIIARYGKEELTDELRLAIQFNDYGAINMFKNWLENKLKLTPNEMANFLVDNMPEIMKKYFD